MTKESSYVPGMCNINTAEIKYRQNVAIGSTALTIILTVVLTVFTNTKLLAIIVLLPAMIAATNYLQVKNKFCVSYGSQGLQNAAEDSKTASRVSARDSAIDKTKSKNMIIQAFAVAIVTTILVGILI